VNRVEIRTAIAAISARPYGPDVARRVDELEQAGQPVTLVCLDTTPHAHTDHADVIHLPLMSAAIAASVVNGLMRNGSNALRVIARLTTRTPSMFHLAQLLARRGITHVQALDPAAARVSRDVMKLVDATPPDLGELPVDWSKLNADRVGVRWFTQRINSIVAEVSIGERRLIVKRQRSHAAGTAADRFAHETAVLAALSAAMPVGRLTTPQVLLADAETAMTIMERARGTSLDLLLAAARRPRAMSAAVEGVRGAGEWLAAMQNATRRGGDGAPLVDTLVAQAVSDVAKLAAEDRLLSGLQTRIVERLETLRRHVAASPVPVVGHHDDYWPGNIFCDGVHVTVIDFESFRDGLPYEDVAYFLIRAGLIVRRFGLDLPDLERRFFDGWLPGREPDRASLQLFKLTKGLRSLAHGIGDDLPLPQRWWTRRTIRQLVVEALEAAD
jgi:hypothetical protein